MRVSSADRTLEVSSRSVVPQDALTFLSLGSGIAKAHGRKLALAFLFGFPRASVPPLFGPLLSLHKRLHDAVCGMARQGPRRRCRR